MNPQVPLMLYYIVAKVLNKTPEARYQSGSDLANDLRECRVELEGGRQAASASLIVTKPIPVPPSPAMGVAPAQADAGEPREEIAAGAAPTKGISRAFDSHDATVRLMRQIGVDGTTTDFVSSPVLSATPRTLTAAAWPRERPWGKRENLIFSATVAVALVVATAIVLL